MHMHKWVIVSLMIALGSLFVMACGASSSGQATVASGEVTIKASEFKLEPGTVRVEVGKPIKLVLKNEGKIEHNVKIVGLTVKGADALLDAKAGESASVEVTPDKVGTFTIECTTPGHKDAGMTGKFEVVSP